MDSNHRIYGSNDIEITLAVITPVKLSSTSVRFKKMIIQNSFTQNPAIPDTTVKVGASVAPSIELINGMSQEFEGGDLSEIYVQGAIGVVVKVHYEY